MYRWLRHWCVVLCGWDLRYYILVWLQFNHTGAIITIFPHQLVGMRFWNSFIGYQSNHNTSSSIVIPNLFNIKKKKLIYMKDNYMYYHWHWNIPSLRKRPTSQKCTCIEGHGSKRCHQILIQLSVYMIPNDSSHTIFNSTTFNFMTSQNMHWKTNWSHLHVK